MADSSSFFAKATSDYRQTLLRLCHDYSDTKIAWDVSQQVLDKIWNDEEASAKKEANGHSGFSSTTLNSTGTTAASLSSSSSASPKGTTASLNYACQACGFELHPGWQGSSLRVKRPPEFSSAASKRTVRRREQIKHKKAVMEEKRNRRSKDYKKQQQRSRQQQATSSTSMYGATKRTVLLRDDPEGTGPLDRNRLVLKCGRCQDKTFLKGLKREDLSTQQSQTATPKKGTKTSHPKSMRTNAVTKGLGCSGGVNNLSENFEKLPKLSNSNKNNKKEPPAAAGIKKKAPPVSLLEQKLGRKKKKTKPGGNKGGGLLDFLSTLNDH